jgi:hypothetical protein
MDKHQLAGIDERERGFCRPVEIEQSGEGVRAVLRYETLRVMTEARDTEATALEELIRTLQSQGYSQLRSQLSVRNGAYRGSQEPWIEYPDPARRPERSDGWLGTLRRWFRRQEEGPHG